VMSWPRLMPTEKESGLRLRKCVLSGKHDK